MSDIIANLHRKIYLKDRLNGLSHTDAINKIYLAREFYITDVKPIYILFEILTHWLLPVTMGIVTFFM